MSYWGNMRRRRHLLTALSVIALSVAPVRAVLAQDDSSRFTAQEPPIAIAASAPRTVPKATPPRIVYGGNPLPVLRIDSAAYRDPADNEICVAPENLAPLGIIFMVDEMAGKVSLTGGDGTLSVTVDLRTPPKSIAGSRGVYVPVMDVINGLGGKSEWEEATNTLYARSVLTGVQRDGSDFKILATLPILPVIKRNETGKILMVDIPGAEVGSLAKVIPSGDPRVTQIRTGQYESDTARVVFEMRESSSMAILSEKPAPEIALRPLADKKATSVATARKAPAVPTQIRSVSFRRISDDRAQISIASSAVPFFKTSLEGAKLSLSLLNSLFSPDAALAMNAIKHPFFKAAELLAGDNRSATLTLSLNRLVNYTVKPDAQGNILLDIGLPRGAGGKLAGKTIVIDPGHGGHDSGALGAGGAREKDVTLAIGLRLADALRDVGANVIMTRADDFFLEVNERPRVANRMNADFFISVHADSTDGDRSINGATIYYHANDEDCRSLGRCIGARITQTSGMKSRGAKTDYIRFPGIGYGVLRNAQMPAVLCETGFMTNPGDLSRLRNPETQQKIAEAIRAGLRDYIEGFTVPDAPREIAPAPNLSNDPASQD